MAYYYSTFTPGFEEAAERFLVNDMPGSGIERVMSGAIHYRRRMPPTSLPWLNNTYLVLMSFNRLKGDPIREMVRLACTRGVDADHLMNHMPAEARTFRALFMVDNLISHVGPKTLEAAEEFLTMTTGLTCDRAKPDVEFWFVYKNEGYGFMLMRLGDKRRDKNKPGEIRTHTAALICRLAQPQHKDVMLDPFAATGTFAGAALQFDFARILACDNSIKNINAMNTRFSGVARVRVLMEDPTQLERVESGSIDKLVTALPPYEGMPALRQLAASLRRVMKRDGILVLLTANPKELTAALSTDYDVTARFDTVIAGKELSVVCARKK